MRDALVDVLHGAAVGQIARQQVLALEPQLHQVLLGGCLDIEVDFAWRRLHLAAQARGFRFGLAQRGFDLRRFVGDVAEELCRGCVFGIEVREAVAREIVAQRLVRGLEPLLDHPALLGQASDLAARQNFVAILEILGHEALSVSAASSGSACANVMRRIDDFGADVTSRSLPKASSASWSMA